ncbi:MAG: DUF5640 domain-containing protein [Defluviitaleaceae bacterium]|nr:DUF5640 domain-containing protein [Defluviitaleaceae bacterium]
MKKFVVLFAVIALIAGGLMLSGCSSRDDDLVGVWQLQEDATFVTTFNDDGRGEHTVDWGFGMSFRWSTSRGNLYWNYTGHSRMYTAYSVSGDVLTITMDEGFVMRFNRVP